VSGYNVKIFFPKNKGQCAVFWGEPPGNPSHNRSMCPVHGGLRPVVR